MQPDVSFVCVTDRPAHLRVLIACLRLQTSRSWELIVLDQSGTGASLIPVGEAQMLGESRIRYQVVDYVGDWGYTAKYEATRSLARGRFVCYPNDDSYYVPSFVEQMIKAATDQDLALVYCDWLFDRAGYLPMDARPVVGRIDTGGFFVKRDLVIIDGWPDRGDTGDGLLVQRICEQHRHGKVPHGVLYVKN